MPEDLYIPKVDNTQNGVAHNTQNGIAPYKPGFGERILLSRPVQWAADKWTPVDKNYRAFLDATTEVAKEQPWNIPGRLVFSGFRDSASGVDKAFQGDFSGASSDIGRGGLKIIGGTLGTGVALKTSAPSLLSMKNPLSWKGSLGWGALDSAYSYLYNANPDYENTDLRQWWQNPNWSDVASIPGYYLGSRVPGPGPLRLTTTIGGGIISGTGFEALQNYLEPRTAWGKDNQFENLINTLSPSESAKLNHLIEKGTIRSDDFGNLYAQTAEGGFQKITDSGRFIRDAGRSGFETLSNLTKTTGLSEVVEGSELSDPLKRMLITGRVRFQPSDGGPFSKLVDSDGNILIGDDGSWTSQGRDMYNNLKSDQYRFDNTLGRVLGGGGGALAGGVLGLLLGRLLFNRGLIGAALGSIAGGALGSTYLNDPIQKQLYKQR